MPDFRAYVRENLRLANVPGAKEAEIVEELALDFDDRYQRAIREGLDPERAWGQIQNQTEWQKVERGFRAAIASDTAPLASPPKRYNPMQNLLIDARYAARILRKSPGFTAIAVLTVALCLGANLTIFAVMDSILLRPLPFPDAGRLVTTINSYPLSGSPHGAASLPNYYDYREKIKAFASTSIITRKSELAIVGAAGSPSRVVRDRVSPEFFKTLGVPLMLGRSFTEAETDYARSGVAILTYSFWRNYFNGDPHVLGRKFQMDGSPTTVVGILPQGFRFLSRQTQLYIPKASGPEERAVDQRHNNEFQLVARLAPGATIDTARKQVAALNAEQLKDDPIAALLKTMGFFSIVTGLHADHVEAIKPTLILLQGGVLFLLLMGAVNLTNLLLIRASGRAKELAVRQALGAGRRHLVSQVMAETVLLTLAGGFLGLALAAGGIRLLDTLGVDQLPLGSYIAFNGRLALVALTGSVALGVLIALPVAWLNLGNQPGSGMQAESRGGSASRAAQHLRHSFIVAQIALAFVLLTGAGLLGVSLKHVVETSPGFQTDQVVTGRITLPYKKYPNETATLALIQRLVRTIEAHPEVLSAGAGDLMPFGGDDDSGVTAVEGFQRTGSRSDVHYRNGIAGDYLRVMGIPLIDGRLLQDADNERPQRVCVVDQVFAERYWPGKSALGHRLNDGPVFNEAESFTIIGEVASVKQTGLDNAKLAGTIYYPYKYWPNPSVSIVVRTPLVIEAVAPMLRRIVLQIDPELLIDNLKPMQSLIDESLVTRRSPAILAFVFAGVALLLTSIGTYGVLAYAVGQRRREIGLRMALGALPRQVLAQFLGLGVKVLLAGVTVGLFGAWAVGRAMQTLLFGVSPMNFGVLAATVGVMIVVVLLASLLPSRRASLVSPIDALRAE